ncbi:PrsW family glutamic-type intramembrane protease [Mordavella massiliensis]|uniref:PrsW family intramembrane metalloprotease n=1 Tax=Mordavella massiliensis TaxID=1871024 RepID=A0A939BGK8_9CLOT|nr:PrsW family intramembrane metalloprotease [Mordavella massiliensis]MBM6947816.1 PrsW family intramembrane metalloprotease [Mordavella massiliensis]
MSKRCPGCGREMKDTDLFCIHCGTKYEEGPRTEADWQPESGFGMDDFVQASKSGMEKVVNTLNDMTGQEGEADIRLRELVSEVFKKHTADERDELFISGTKKTTPAPENMVSDWPHPWLFARIFLMFLLVFAGLLVMITQFDNLNGVPGAMFIGALAVPFSLMVFFWETNIPRNISIFEAVSIFFVGGVMSLICTLILYNFIQVGELNYTGAVLVGIIEEIGKIVVVGHYIKKMNTGYILNGLLLGSCVGAGFAVFETAGYAFNALLLSGSVSGMVDILVLRGAMAVGGHTLWAAISAAGLVIAKGDRPFDKRFYLEPGFLKFLVLVIILHAVWDMPIRFGESMYLVQWILCAVAVLVALVILSSGLRQMSAVVKEAKKKRLEAGL